MLFPIPNLTAASAQKSNDISSSWPWPRSSSRQLQHGAQIRLNNQALVGASHPSFDLYVAISKESSWAQGTADALRWPTKGGDATAAAADQLRANYSLLQQLLDNPEQDMQFWDEGANSFSGGHEYLLLQTRHHSMHDGLARLTAGQAPLQFFNLSSSVWSALLRNTDAPARSGLAQLGQGLIGNVDGCSMQTLLARRVQGEPTVPIGALFPSHGLLAMRLAAPVTVSGSSSMYALHQSVSDTLLAFPLIGNYFSGSLGPRLWPSEGFSSILEAFSSGSAAELASGFRQDVERVQLSSSRSQHILDLQIPLPGGALFSTNPSSFVAARSCEHQGEVRFRASFSAENLEVSETGAAVLAPSSSPFVVTLDEAAALGANGQLTSSTINAPVAAISRIGLYDRLGELYGIASLHRPAMIGYRYRSTLEQLEPWLPELSSSGLVARIIL